jgi:NADPH2:quinone reductase
MGGSGGIGTSAITLINYFGGNIIVTCSNDEKCQKAIELGASHAINYNNKDFEEEVLKIASNGIDIVLDAVGGDYCNKNLNILKEQGTLIAIGTMQGVSAHIDLLKVIKKRLIIMGSILRTLDLYEKKEIIRQLNEKILPEINQGSIKPIIYKEFDFIRAADAIEELKKRNHFGKIVIKCTR